MIGQGIYPIQTPDSKNYLAEALSNFVPSIAQGMETAAKPFDLQQKLLAAQLGNKIKQAEAQYAMPMEAAKLELAQAMPGQTRAATALDWAQTNHTNTMTPLEAIKQELENQWYPKKTQSEINWKNMGGSGASAGGKNEIQFQHFVQMDNPQLKPEQVYEAANVLRQGGDQLADGTKLNPLSPAAMEAANRVVKAGTYSGAITPLVKAKQADAELKVLMDMSQKDFAPYATTYNGYSPEQIMDTFKSDKESQLRLGNFIASQAAQYEAAQIRNRIAGGEPGVSATQELMGHSGQIIKSRFPKLSAVAREQAAKRLDEYLAEGLKARLSVGSNLANLNQDTINKTYKPVSVALGNSSLGNGSDSTPKVTKRWTMQELMGAK